MANNTLESREMTPLRTGMRVPAKTSVYSLKNLSQLHKDGQAQVDILDASELMKDLKRVALVKIPENLMALLGLKEPFRRISHPQSGAILYQVAEEGLSQEGSATIELIRHVTESAQRLYPYTLTLRGIEQSLARNLSLQYLLNVEMIPDRRIETSRCLWYLSKGSVALSEEDLKAIPETHAEYTKQDPYLSFYRVTLGACRMFGILQLTMANILGSRFGFNIENSCGKAAFGRENTWKIQAPDFLPTFDTIGRETFLSNEVAERYPTEWH